MPKYFIYFPLIFFTTLSCNKNTQTVVYSQEKKQSENEIPTNGAYIYSVVFAEHEGLVYPNAVRVVINNKHIILKNNGALSGVKGEVIDEGTIMKHKNGNWIIAHNEIDINSEEIGGCSDGPIVVNFKNKMIYLC